MRRGFQLLVPCLVLVGCALVAPAGGLSDTVKDPNAIACPAAPAGWSALPVNKYVRTPNTVSTLQPESYLSGGSLVSISCVYFASESARTTVTLAYALPSDPNPFSDFNYGCGKGDVPWNAQYGVLRTASIDQWAYATFASTRSPLSGNDVSDFASIARRLLASAGGYAHACDAVAAAKVTAVTPGYAFNFVLANRRVQAAFWIATPSNTKGPYRIERVTATRFPLPVTLDGKSRTLTVALDRGIAYRPAATGAKAQATFRIRVVGPSAGTCRTGTTGTLTLTSGPSIHLGLCAATVRSPLTSLRIYQQ